MARERAGSGLEMLLERIPIAKLLPHANNARMHSPEQLERLRASIVQHGFAFPVVVNRHGELIAGHARLEASRQLGLDEVPAVRLTRLTEKQERALRIADNRIAELATWDEDKLALELAELATLEIPLESIGFDQAELELLLHLDGNDAPAKLDDVPEASPIAIARPGDLWQLGEHRLLCGDATNGGDVARLLAGDVPAMMVTDPPYGVSYEPKWRNEGRVGRQAIGHSTENTVENDDRASWQQAWEHFPGDVAYVWCSALRSMEVAADLKAADFELRAQIVWVKQTFIISRGHYHWQHEPCWYAVRRGATARWCGDRKQSTVWHVNGLQGYMTKAEGLDARQEHGTQKPVELVLRALANHTGEGDLIYDPFVGSGTTLVACEHARRRCLALEIDPRCVDMVLRRWRTLVGREPTRDGRALVELEA